MNSRFLCGDSRWGRRQSPLSSQRNLELIIHISEIVTEINFKWRFPLPSRRIIPAFVIGTIFLLCYLVTICCVVKVRARFPVFFLLHLLQIRLWYYFFRTYIKWTVCPSWINKKTNAPSIFFFRFPLILMKDKIKQHVLFSTSANSNQCF